MGWKEELRELGDPYTIEASISRQTRDRILLGFLKESAYAALRQTKESVSNWGYDVELSPQSESSLHIGEGGGVMLIVRRGLRPLAQESVAFRVIPSSFTLLRIDFDKPFGELESHSLAFGFSIMSQLMPLLEQFLAANEISRS